jgi:ferrochelatase
MTSVEKIVGEMFSTRQVDGEVIEALWERVQRGLEEHFPAEVRSRVVVVFSAHSVPMMVVHRGDPYVQEVAATTQAVMDRIPAADRPPFVLAWQSKVGFLPWMGPSTAGVLKGLARQGHEDVLVVPVTFTTDHIETLYEVDVEYAELAHQLGIKRFHRAQGLNDSPRFVQALAELTASHLDANELCTPQYPYNCHGCTNPMCRSLPNPGYAKLRDTNAANKIPRAK